MLVNSGCFYVLFVVKIPVCQNEQNQKWSDGDIGEGGSRVSGGGHLWRVGGRILVRICQNFGQWSEYPPTLFPLEETLWYPSYNERPFQKP